MLHGHVRFLGPRRRDRLTEALETLDLQLTPDDLARIERAVPDGAVAGNRYDPYGTALLDSERDRAALA